MRTKISYKMNAKLLIYLCCIIFWGCEINQKNASDLFLIDNKPKEISIEGFYMDDSEIGEYKNVNPQKPNIEIYNMKTGNHIDLDVPLHLFFNDKKIEIKDNWFSLDVLTDIAKDTNRVTIKLEIADFSYIGIIPTYSFEDFVRFQFHMNFDSKNGKCNKTYFGNSAMETMVQTILVQEGKENTTVLCNGETNQTLEVIRLYAGTVDDGWFEFYDTQAGQYSKFNGKYTSRLNDTTSVTFELADSAKLNLTFNNKDKILRQVKGEWYFMPSDNNIRFNIFLPILLQQKENIIKLNAGGLEPKESDSLQLSFFTYQLKNDKIVKSNLIELKKELD